MVNTFVFSTCLYLFKEIIKKKLSGYEVFFAIKWNWAALLLRTNPKAVLRYLLSTYKVLELYVRHLKMKMRPQGSWGIEEGRWG